MTPPSAEPIPVWHRWPIFRTALWHRVLKIHRRNARRKRPMVINGDPVTVVSSIQPWTRGPDPYRAVYEHHRWTPPRVAECKLIVDLQRPLRGDHIQLILAAYRATDWFNGADWGAFENILVAVIDATAIAVGLRPELP